MFTLSDGHVSRTRRVQDGHSSHPLAPIWGALLSSEALEKESMSLYNSLALLQTLWLWGAALV